jgi:cell division protein FtsQ
VNLRNITFFTSDFKRKVSVFLTFVLLFGLISFVEKKQSEKVCTQVDIRIGDTYSNYFIHESDILALMTKGGTEPLVGKPYQNIDLKNLELRIKTNKFIRNCEVARNLKGELTVDIQQNRPIARIIQRNAPDAYISDDGRILPMSDRFTARVPLIEGDNLEHYVNNGLLADEEGQALFQLLQYIDNHKFWKAQIAQLNVSRDGNIHLYPQIGRQTIEFGSASDIESKFRKLMIFYKKILPVKGWNNYTRVSLAYQNQIICE